MTGNRRVLFMEEGGVMAEAIIECLQNHGYECRFVEAGTRDLTSDDFSNVDVILFGLRENGNVMVTAIDNLNSLSGGKPIIILSSIGRPPTMNDVRTSGARGMVNTPFRTRELLDALEDSFGTGA